MKNHIHTILDFFSVYAKKKPHPNFDGAKSSLNSFFVYILPLIVMLLNVLIILFPKEIISASKDGISLWFNNVMPSLLPFVIGTNMLIGLGAVSFFGTLLEPLMTKLFNVPGCGAFAYVLGMTSGYPMGAKITADLRLKNELTKAEAERLLTFSNNCGPLFILGSVASGMFSNAPAGYFMLLIHLSAAFTTGLIFRGYKYDKRLSHKKSNSHLLKKSLYNLKSARIKDGRSFGAILGDSVKNSMETMVIIGGFIILFSVIVEALKITNILKILEGFAIDLGERAAVTENIYSGLIIGLLEITNGCKMLSEDITPTKIIIAAGIISWGGLSIHAQTINFLQKTDISIGIYLISKLIHFAITIIYGFLFYPFLSPATVTNPDVVVPVFGDNFFYSLMISGRDFLIVVSIIALLSFSAGFIISKVRRT